MNESAIDLLVSLASECPLAVGIDPDIKLFSREYLNKFISLQNKSANQEGICQAVSVFVDKVLENINQFVRVVKFQIAYFEALGSKGLILLAEKIKLARDMGFFVILDAKRGDIGSTATAYSKYLNREINILEGETSYINDMYCEALTINPFLGFDSMEPFVQSVVDNNSMVFVLVKTSNIGSKMIQDQVTNFGTSISEIIAKWVTECGTRAGYGKSGFSKIGAVVGGTDPSFFKKARELMPNTFFLIPGIGSQGGDVNSLRPLFDGLGRGGIINASRSITFPHNLINPFDSNYVNQVKRAISELIEKIDNCVSTMMY
jgi:orotidine-5'-phosphate decarboxylase